MITSLLDQRVMINDEEDELNGETGVVCAVYVDDSDDMPGLSLVIAMDKTGELNDTMAYNCKIHASRKY